MKVISIVGYKGGTAKTTLAVNLADVFGERMPTVLIDSDPQESAKAWFGDAQHVRVVSIRDPHALETSLSQQWNGLAIVDGRPGDPDLITAAMQKADLVLVPLRPSALDLHANLPILETLRNNPMGLVVITLAPPHSRDTETMRRVLVERYEVTVASTVIWNRIAHSRAPLSKKSVCDVEPRGQAAAEILELAEEVSTLMGLGK